MVRVCFAVHHVHDTLSVNAEVNDSFKLLAPAIPFVVRAVSVANMGAHCKNAQG